MESDPKTKNENMKTLIVSPHIEILAPDTRTAEAVAARLAEGMAHTPAPWAYTEGLSPHYQGQVYREDNGHTVAVTYHDEDGANARLIAAAPAMLAACQHVLSVLENPPPNKPGGVSRTMLREAIARATASSPNPTKP